jgi:hypothetical protein
MKKLKPAEDRLEKGIKTAIAALNATLLVIALKKAFKKKK